MQTRIQLAYLARFSSEYLDISGEIHRFDAAREIHEKLSHLLGDDKRVFFDQRIPEEIKEDHNELQQIDTISVDISSLDIVAWCYLKEELVNTSESKEVAYLKEKFSNLIKFVTFMDTYFKENSRKSLTWNQPDMAQKIVNSL